MGASISWPGAKGNPLRAGHRTFETSRATRLICRRWSRCMSFTPSGHSRPKPCYRAFKIWAAGSGRRGHWSTG